MGDIVFIINAVITVFIFIIRMNVVDGQEEDILLQQQHRQQQQVASSLRNLKQAYMEIVFYTEDVGNGGFLTTTYQIKGKFAKYGTHFAAEGRLKKVDLNSICNATDYYPPRLPFGWVALLEVTETNGRTGQSGDIKANCMSTVDKVEHVLRQGARAALVSYNNDYNVYKKLGSLDSVKPVVMVTLFDSQRIKPMIGRGRKNFIRIKARTLPRQVPIIHQQDFKNNEYFDMGIFLAFFIIVSLICLILLIKLKWRQNRKKHFRVKVAVEALKSMRIRKHTTSRGPPVARDISDSNCDGENTNSFFGIKTCTVCLEELNCRKDIRILPCNHEFHQECIDPWLITNFTCPLCMYSIIETKKLKYKSRSVRIPEFIARRFRTTNPQSTSELANTIHQDQSADTEMQLPRAASSPTRPATNYTNQLPRVSSFVTLLATNNTHSKCNHGNRYPQQRNGSTDSEVANTHTFRFHTCPFHHNKRKTTGSNVKPQECATTAKSQAGRVQPRICYLQTTDQTSYFQKETAVGSLRVHQIVKQTDSERAENTNFDKCSTGINSRTVPLSNQLLHCSQNLQQCSNHSESQATIEIQEQCLPSVENL